MPITELEDPGEVFQVIQSGKPTIIHYWIPDNGESPLLDLFEQASANRPDIDFYIVHNGFIAPPNSPDELPLTVFYIGGGPVTQAPLDRGETEALIYGMNV